MLEHKRNMEDSTRHSIQAEIVEKFLVETNSAYRKATQYTKDVPYRRQVHTKDAEGKNMTLTFTVNRPLNEFYD